MKNIGLVFFISSFLFAFLLPCSISFAQPSACQLPSWFFENSNYTNGNYAIGISDTRMDIEEAYEQAKLKALLNYSLLHKTNFSSLTTSGLGNQQDNANNATSLEYVVHSAIIKGEFSGPEEIQIVDSFYTPNKEAIVLIKINKNSENLPVYKYAIKRRAGFQRENTRLPLFADELDIIITNNDSIIYSSKIFKESNRISNQNTKTSSSIFDFMSEIQIFKPYISFQQADPRSLPSPLNFGLWNAYIFNFVDQVCIYNSFKTDFHYKLSSSNMGTMDDKSTKKTLQQYVYSLKNVQSRNIKTKLKNIAIENNQLYCYFKPAHEKYDFNQNTISVLNRQDRKELKKLKEENWQFVGTQNVKNAWFEAKNRISSSPDYLVTGIDIQSNNLSSGLLESIYLAKLELSSLLEAKISALTLQNQTDEKQSYTQSAKLLNITKTAKIEPFYMFYRQINPKAYMIKVVLFYKLNK